MKAYMQRYHLAVVSAFLLLLILAKGCEKDELLTNSTAKLSFSQDTVMFDTVFTGIGSATKRFKVYNNHDAALKISSIRMAKGSSSNFHMNVDGVAANSIRNYEIKAKDSIFVFVEVFVDPSNDDLIEKDSIIFSLNGGEQDVKMRAFGQNVHLLRNALLPTQTWTNDKPYLIYTSSMVDTLETLTVEAGTKIYFHQGASLFVKGSLKVNGSPANPIVFSGDRLENFYSDKPGQWGAYTILSNGATYVFGGLHFMPGSFENVINYAEIKNANKGIQLDSAIGNQPALRISNTKISNMNTAGIYAQTSTINGDNLVINNCGSHAIALTLGGSYRFNHVTIANYTPYNSRNSASVAINNYYLSGGGAYVYELEEATFTNSIIYGDGGDQGNEIVIDDAGDGGFNYLFDHCLIRVNEDFEPDQERFKNIIWSPQQGPRFMSRTNYDFRLDTLSPAINAGSREYGNLNPTDFDGESRMNDEAPDLGAFERVP
jgi:hypothetical protein